MTRAFPSSSRSAPSCPAAKRSLKFQSACFQGSDKSILHFPLSLESLWLSARRAGCNALTGLGHGLLRGRGGRGGRAPAAPARGPGRRHSGGPADAHGDGLRPSAQHKGAHRAGAQNPRQQHRICGRTAGGLGRLCLRAIQVRLAPPPGGHFDAKNRPSPLPLSPVVLPLAP